MSDLPSGSTVGGKLIIHKGIANDHRHRTSEIDGLGINADNYQGDGGGIEAAVLSGKTFNDLSNEFLNVSSDTISSLELAKHPTEDTEAASKLSVSNRATEGFTNGDFYGLTSIGTVSQELSYIVLNEYVVRINETDIMVNGWLGGLPEQNIDIRDINPNYTNKSFYLFVESVKNEFVVSGSETKELNTDNKIFAGRIDTDGSGIAQVDIVNGVARFGIGKYMLSKTPAPDSIVISKDTGLIDDGWLVGSKGEMTTFLNGPTLGRPTESLVYNITNYNSFSAYEVRTSLPEISASITGDTITLQLPEIIPNPTTEQLIVSRDGFESSYGLELLGDPLPEISGPSTIQSGDVLVYTIDNYNELYTYIVTADVTGFVFLVEGNQITVTAPLKNPFGQDVTLGVSRGSGSTDVPVTFVADQQISLSGPQIVVIDSTNTYEIINYNPNYTYTVSNSLGTASRSGSTVVLNTSGIVDDGTDKTIDIVVSREGSSDAITVDLSYTQPYEIQGRDVIWPGENFVYNITPYDSTLTYNINTQLPHSFDATTGAIALAVPDGTDTEYYDLLTVQQDKWNITKNITILGNPEPYDIVLNGEATANIHTLIGSPIAALDYTVNVTGILNGSTAIVESYTLSTGWFRQGSTLTLNINNATLYAKGGAGGGRGTGMFFTPTASGAPGDDVISVQVPTHLTITNSTLRAGGGGGGGALRRYYEPDSGGKGFADIRTVSLAPGGGGTSYGTSVATVSNAVGNVTAYNAGEGKNGGLGVGGSSRDNEYNEINGDGTTFHGTFIGYGGWGGGGGSAGLGASGSATNGATSFTQEFQYSSVDAYTVETYGGFIGVGGAGGVAVRGNGNVLTFNQSNNAITGNINT